jgi:hypothetical protein
MQVEGEKIAKFNSCIGGLSLSGLPRVLISSVGRCFSSVLCKHVDLELGSKFKTLLQAHPFDNPFTRIKGRVLQG